MKAVLPLARDQRGFTLAELLVVIAILGLMLAGLVTVQMQGQNSYLIGSHRVEAQQNGRVALELMVRELRSAQSVTALGSATDLTFVTCKNPYPTSAPTTPCLPADVVTVRYQLSGTTLNRTENGVTTPLIGGVQTLTLTYLSAYNGSTGISTTATTPASVQLIRLQLVTRTEQSVANYSASNQHATVEMMVRLRNM